MIGIGTLPLPNCKVLLAGTASKRGFRQRQNGLVSASISCEFQRAQSDCWKSCASQSPAHVLATDDMPTIRQICAGCERKSYCAQTFCRHPAIMHTSYGCGMATLVYRADQVIDAVSAPVAGAWSPD